MVHLRDDFQRPPIKLEPTYHPLAVDQREGISMQRLGEILGPLGADMGKGGTRAPWRFRVLACWPGHQKAPPAFAVRGFCVWLRGQDLNL